MSDYCKTDLYQLMFRSSHAYTNRKKHTLQRSLRMQTQVFLETAPLNCLRCLCNPQYGKSRPICEIYVKLKQLVCFLVRVKNKKLRREKNALRSWRLGFLSFPSWCQFPRL